MIIARCIGASGEELRRELFERAVVSEREGSGEGVPSPGVRAKRVGVRAKRYFALSLVQGAVVSHVERAGDFPKSLRGIIRTGDPPPESSGGRSSSRPKREIEADHLPG